MIIRMERISLPSGKDCSEIMERTVMETEKRLIELLRENADTEFGRDHHFNQIRSISDYRRNVPLSRYEDYAGAIDRMYAGKTGILTAYPLCCFATTSGSTGRPKKIPLTWKGLSSFGAIYTNMMQHTKDMPGKHIHLSVFRTWPGSRDKKLLLTEAAYRDLYERGIFNPDCYVGGHELTFTKEIGNILYVKLWSALSEEDLLSIQSAFLYDVLLFFEYMKEHGMEMLYAMERKIIPGEIQISEPIRRKLVTELCPSDERIDFLRREFTCGYDSIASRIWKNLRMVSGIGGSFFRSRERLLRSFTGEIPWHYFLYASSESFTGYAEGLENPYYTVIPENGFFEFMDMETGRVLEMNEVEKGKQYEPVITNFSGLYRYQQGDIIRVVGFQGDAAVIEVIMRKDQALDIAGEKTNTAMLEEAVLRFSTRLGIYLHDYAVAADVSRFPAGYLLYIEPEEEIPFIKDTSQPLDRSLCEVNPDYKDLRERGFLGEPRVVCLAKGELGSRNEYPNSSQNKPRQTILHKPLLQRNGG